MNANYVRTQFYSLWKVYIKEIGLMTSVSAGEVKER